MQTMKNITDCLHFFGPLPPSSIEAKLKSRSENFNHFHDSKKVQKAIKFMVTNGQLKKIETKTGTILFPKGYK